jgi:hypothetical protein
MCFRIIYDLIYVGVFCALDDREGGREGGRVGGWEERQIEWVACMWGGEIKRGFHRRGEQYVSVRAEPCRAAAATAVARCVSCPVLDQTFSVGGLGRLVHWLFSCVFLMLFINMW